MAEEHLIILKQGVTAWNRFMRDHAYEVRADFRRANLAGMDLTKAVMDGADFQGADLRGAILTAGAFRRANFNDAILTNVRAESAHFLDSNFVRTKFERAHLVRAQFGGANLSETDFSHSLMTAADLMSAFLSRAILRNTTLDDAVMRDCRCFHSELVNASLMRADLTYAHLVESTFSGANLSGCSVYGISVWGSVFDGAVQADLLITPESDPPIRTDNIAVAQFLYLLLNNPEIRHAIDAITSKVVLILGRFTRERKAVLDALRARLRTTNYVPVLFDFDGPFNRDITETISTIAHMSRFVVADITDARSIPQELMTIVPALPSVPVQILLLASEPEYGMFEHFKRYPWVLAPFEYESDDHLLANLDSRVIAPAEEKAKDLTGRR